MTKAGKVLELSEMKNGMLTDELKSLVAYRKEVDFRYRDFSTILAKLIDDLHTPVSKENAKDVTRRVGTLRDMMLNLQTTIGNINLDFVLKIPK